MGRLRSWVRRVERGARPNQLNILQKDGTVVKFPTDAPFEAFVHEAERLRAIHHGEDPGEPHPLTAAKRNAMHPQPYVFDADRQHRNNAG